MANEILKVISTIDSNLNKIPISNGQLIFVKDTKTICMDMSNIRTTYHQITELPTEASRLSLLAPVVGFYFCLDTSVLWRYEEDWIQITSQPAEHITSANTYLNFPAIGKSNVLYIDTQANKCYRWDDIGLKYFVVGSDYNDIKVINGGNSSGE